MVKILIVDDEFIVLDIVEDYLKREDYTVYSAQTGKKALELFRSSNPDLVILDLMLPDISGEELCKIIRSESRVPILMLTAKSHEEDRISGLSMGADDYLIKPFSPRELVVRIRAILRRVAISEPLSDTIEFSGGKFRIDAMRHQVLKNEKIMDFTPSEYKLLVLLASNPGKVFTRDELVRISLGYDYDGYERTIDTHVKNMRRKLEDDIKSPKIIKTVFGVGYKFDRGNL